MYPDSHIYDEDDECDQLFYGHLLVRMSYLSLSATSADFYFSLLELCSVAQVPFSIPRVLPLGSVSPMSLVHEK